MEKARGKGIKNLKYIRYCHKMNHRDYYLEVDKELMTCFTTFYALSLGKVCAKEN